MARQGRVARLYLLAYNCAQAAGWAYSGWLLAQHVAATGSLRGAYAAAGEPVREWA